MHDGTRSGEHETEARTRSAAVTTHNPSVPNTESPLLRRRLAVFAFMLVFGIGMSSWVVRTPAVRDLLTASTAEMGLMLLGLSMGSMTGVLTSAAFVRRHGVRLTVTLGGAAFTLGIALVGVSASLSSTIGVFVGLALTGLGIGFSEIALNLEGAAIETALGRSVLPAMHGCFSLGTVLGSVAGIGLTAIAFPVLWQLVGVAVISSVLLGTVIRQVSPVTGREVAATTGESASAPHRSLLQMAREPRVLMLGAIVLALALAEGSAMDWLPLLMVDGHGASATVGTIVFAGFATAMTVGRFLGAPLLARFGNVAVLRVSALISAAGIAIVVFVDSPFAAGCAVVLWGLGAALGFPVTLSAAADSDDPTSSVAAVATVGYIAFLVGPPLLGFLGEHFGLRGAMILVLVLVAAASFLTRAAGPRMRNNGS
ncbi:MFS transporter (plasmid) [Clavibacter capsici]|uniref:MFS transporter n=1 Tax=Clavibacter capsici TaxID=1874630 RepID=UPI0009BE44FE|nr:MFS transporter [Clavibacter capsici]QIS40524.1 MFS transporter [Clavibacter capsici]QIS43546.1 MFS transporter [Clavibacter capsici]